ncbi:hypothetical protein [Nonomuraea sp. NPDC049646]|uniref:hypothetical protein n=1 Tax=unclassified Nonomuraea TaxID=2593643 RepID=UPI0037A6359C
MGSRRRRRPSRSRDLALLALATLLVGALLVLTAALAANDPSSEHAPTGTTGTTAPAAGSGRAHG